MPRAPKAKSTRGYGYGGHDSDDDSFSSSSSDMNDFVTAFAGRTIAELKAGKPIHYSKDLKKTIITHGITYAYCAKAPPSLPVFLDLFLEKLAGKNLPKSKNVTKACIQSVATEISTLLSARGTGGLIKDDPVRVATALIKVVDEDKLEMNMFRNGFLEDLHAESGRKMKAVVVAEDALPTSPPSLARLVISHLIQTGYFNRANNNAIPTLFGRQQPTLPAPARYSNSTTTITNADAQALATKKKSDRAQALAYKNFAKFVCVATKDEGAMEQDLLDMSWKWNGGKIHFDEAKDYVAWQQWLMEGRIDGKFNALALPEDQDQDVEGGDGDGDGE